ncbi:DUF6174 domain-containing protein [bacterium]|nr:DUF6174 domain-containing protein [bacterium]
MTSQNVRVSSLESWILQQSSDGAKWTDLVPLEGSRDMVGFGVKADRATLGIGDLEKVFFRAKKFSRNEEVKQKYLAALARWDEFNLTNYSYLVNSNQGMISYEARYTVVDGEVTEVETILAWPPFFEPPPSRTIEDWFATVASAIDQNAVTIEIDWNSELGYPESGFIDISRMLADEERGWTISEITPLE